MNLHFTPTYSRGIPEAIDMDSYSVEKNAVMQIALADANAQIEPVPVEGGRHRRTTGPSVR